MTFKATIKAGLAEVSTTECSDLELVTQDKHTIHGATAVYAYDRLHELVGKHCISGTPRGDGKADDMGLALGQVLENQSGVIGRQEREIERLKRELRAVGAQCEPYGNFRHITAGTLGHIRCVLDRELPLGLTSEVRAERVDGVPLGTVKIVIQEGTGNPAPAVTKDTPVTLGMLRELNARGDVLWNKRYGTKDSTETVMGLALAEKLGVR